MMNQQPDKLFREKLAGYTKSVPDGAWNKIEKGLAKKNNHKMWLKIAASLMVAALAAYWLWPDKAQKQLPVANKNEKTITPDELPVNPQNNIAEKQPLSSVTEKPAPEIEQQKKRDTHDTGKEKASSALTIEEVRKPWIAKKEEPSLLDENQIDESITSLKEEHANESIVTTADTTPKEENITLIFTAEEANNYLDKKALAKATSDEKKSSTFKKLLKKASDLKNHEDPFGDLRQKKDEILALNFKTKERGQNK